MTRRAKIIWNIVIGIAALLVILIVVAALVIQTAWFHAYLERKIVAAAEDSTGGRVDLGGLGIDWRRLRAVATNFTIHGTEPPGSPPFFHVARIEVDLRLFTSLGHSLDLTYLRLDRPEANILVLSDGHTNLPTPKNPSPSNTSALETIVDLAVRHFELTNGQISLNSQKQAIEARGENLRAQLFYSALKQDYEGQISLQPLYVVSGKNTPVKFALALPIVLGRDRIDVRDASIFTPASRITINASVEDLRNPKTSAHIAGRLALADLKNLGDLSIAPGPRLPAAIDLDANAAIAEKEIRISRLHVELGQSSMDASGNLVGSGAALDFGARLALGELGRLLKSTALPEDSATVSGKAKIDANRLLVSDMRVNAFGGEIAGNASLEDFARYKLNADLRHFDVRTVAGLLGEKNLPYDGVASGPVTASGDLNVPGAKSVMASARISIAPGTRGVAVSGQLNAEYSGASEDVAIRDSFLALPHTRMTFGGSLAKRIDFDLTTRDLSDLLATAQLEGPPPVTLEAGGQAVVAGAVTGSLSAPRVTAHLTANRFRVEGRHFDSLALDAAASSSGAAVSNGALNRNTMQARFTASMGLRNWKAPANAPVSLDATMRNGDLADAIVLAGQPASDYSGALSITASVRGTLGNPLGMADIESVNGMIRGEPFDRIQARVNMTDRLISIPGAFAQAGAARVDVTASFEHPRDSFDTGVLKGHLQSSRLDLAQFRTLQKQWPKSGGEVQIQADGAVNFKQSGSEREFVPVAVSADISARGLRFEGQNYGDLTATAETRQQTVHYNLTSNFAESSIRVNGDTDLTRDYPTRADATIGSLAIERVLSLQKTGAIPAKGNLSATAHFMGTIKNPEGDAELNLTNAVLYEEPIDRVRARVQYLARSVDVSQFEASAGPARVNLTARYDHPAGDLESGNLQFRANASGVDLARIRNVQILRPGLAGAAQFEANGAAAIQPAGQRILVRDLTANLSAKGIAMQGKNLGDLTLAAQTTRGRLNFSLDSNLAEASIQGSGSAELSGDYPVNANLTFNNVTWTRLQPLLGSIAGGPASFDAATDGEAMVEGPATKTAELRGSLRLTRLNLSATPQPGTNPRAIVIQNAGPIAVSLDRGTARIDSLHLTGSQTDIQARGTASLQGGPLDLNVNGNANLAVLQQLSRDVVSSGTVTLAATVRGTMPQPLVNGSLELHNASLNDVNFPNGISNANGAIQFNGASASLRNITAESGGGKVVLSGFATYRNMLRFGLRANATNVRVRVQEGISAAMDANIELAGGAQGGAVTGTVTLTRLTYEPQSDFGSMLARALPPVGAETQPSFLDKMKLDIQVRTSPSTAIRSSIAQSLRLNADLRIRGSASQPGALGRVVLTGGKLIFFGTEYDVDTGDISFFNPARIEPALNLTFKAQAQGVNITVKVTGPVDNMKLSYTSDPPLQFQEIVELLAAGTTPTSDPTILANQPAPPQQSYTQMGESFLVGKALADPVTNRLQRVFGVSQLKVDPTFASGSTLPQARLTLQQRVSSNITFTYVTALDQSNTQIIRIEWALNPQWSAIGTRDENGIVGVRFAYKKQFR